MELGFSRNARKFLEDCDNDTYSILTVAVNSLLKNPFPNGFKKIEGRKERVFRIRIGKYRILYSLIKDKNLLFISNIDKRSTVYD